jgi:hypothetical protein
MRKTEVVRHWLVTLVAPGAICLLLIIAASCSFERQPRAGSVGQQNGKAAVEEHAKEEFVVANPFCSACHYGFDEEQLALDHQLVGIGCERCHGESERHRSDEDNITPPEIMYPKSRINPTCMMCHPRHEIRRVHAHEPILAGAETIFDAGPSEAKKSIYCTDCHGEGHRVRVPRVRWDKGTGRLIGPE